MNYYYNNISLETQTPTFIQGKVNLPTYTELQRALVDFLDGKVKVERINNARLYFKTKQQGPTYNCPIDPLLLYTQEEILHPSFEEKLQQFYQKLRDGLQQKDLGQGEVELTYIYPQVLKSSMDILQEGIYREDFDGTLTALVVLDRGQCKLLPYSFLKVWKGDKKSLFDVAYKNLAKRSWNLTYYQHKDLSFFRSGEKGITVNYLTNPQNLGSSLQGSFGTLAIIPAIDQVYLHPLNDLEHDLETAFHHLMDCLEEVAKEKTLLSQDIYWQYEGKWISFPKIQNRKSIEYIRFPQRLIDLKKQVHRRDIQNYFCDDLQYSNFWAWFEEHEYSLYSELSVNEDLFDQLDERLKSIHPDISFVLEDSGSARKKIVLTSNYSKQAFCFVKTLVESNPGFHRWEIQAFKSARPKVNIGLPYGDEDLLFCSDLRFAYAWEEDKLGLQIYVESEKYTEETQDVIAALVESVLGEAVFMQQIAWILIKTYDKEKSMKDYFELKELTTIIREKALQCN